MSSNIFFKKKKISTKNIFSKNNLKRNFIIDEIKPLVLSQKNDLTFFDSIKYKFEASKTNAGACLTTDKLSNFLSKNTQPIIVKNVLFELAKVSKMIYPTADVDYPDTLLRVM